MTETSTSQELHAQFSGDLNELDSIRRWCQTAVAKWDESDGYEDLLNRVQLSCVEVATNIIRHGGDTSDRHIIHFRTEQQSPLRIKIEHNGSFFEPVDIADIDGPLEGGMGLFLIDQCTTDVSYERSPEGNPIIELEFETPS